MGREYTKEQWGKERALTLQGIPLKCPNPKCGRLGTYKAYTQPAVEMYCMCKFCGFWQAVGEKPKQCNIFHHNCKGNKQLLPPGGHPRKGYCWIAADEVGCEYCDEVITNKVKWPVDDPDHPLLKP